MKQSQKMSDLLGAVLIAVVMLPQAVLAQADSNHAPGRYREDVGWAKHGAGRNFGSTIGIQPDRDGQSIWVSDRCGGETCEASNIDPLTTYDASGRVVATLGARLFNRPHGFFVDDDGRLWLTDGIGTPPGAGTPGIGSARDGKVTAFIEETRDPGSLEATTADPAGNVYAGYTSSMDFRRFVKK